MAQPYLKQPWVNPKILNKTSVTSKTSLFKPTISTSASKTAKKIVKYLRLTKAKLFMWCHDIQYNDVQHSDTLHINEEHDTA